MINDHWSRLTADDSPPFASLGTSLSQVARANLFSLEMPLLTLSASQRKVTLKYCWRASSGRERKERTYLSSEVSSDAR